MDEETCKITNCSSVQYGNKSMDSALGQPHDCGAIAAAVAPEGKAAVRYVTKTRME